MTIDQLLQAAFFNIENRNFWFIRTFGGSFFEEFVQHNFIAIDNDNVQYSEILEAQKSATKSLPSQKIIGNLIKVKNPGATFQNVHARALLDFCFNIKENDIVFIPDVLNDIQFGVVKDNTLDININPVGECPYIFRRKVEWFEKKRRRELDAEVWPLFRTIKTVNNANKYANLLNPALNSLYHLNDQTHLVLDVTTANPINGRTLFTLGNDLLDLSEDLNAYFGITSDAEIDVKIELKSPGTIELITCGMLSIAAIGLIIVGLAGGKWKFKASTQKWKFEGDFQSNSLIEKVNEYMNDGVERQNKLADIQKKCEELGIVDKKGNIRKLMNKK